MSTSKSRAKLITILLAATALGLFVCRSCDDDDGETAYIAGVFYDFVAIGQNRLVAEKEKKDVPHLYVARFGADGRARTMRSFEPLAVGRATSFVATDDEIRVVGILKDDLTIDSFHLTAKTPGNDAVEATFFAIFDREGNAVHAEVVARARKMHRAKLQPDGGKLNLKVQFEGPVSVPGHDISGRGVILDLQLSQEGKVKRVQVIESPTKEQAGAEAPAQQGAMLRDEGGSQWGWMLASHTPTATPCDICSPTAGQPGYKHCEDCALQICTDSRYAMCCDESWNQSCMREANSRCNQTDTFCACSHQTRVRGWVMQRFCEPPSDRATCAKNVIIHRASCADSLDLYNGWDSDCTAKATTAWICAGGAGP